MIRSLIIIGWLSAAAWAGPPPTLGEELAEAHDAEAKMNLAKAESIYVDILKSHRDADTFQRLGLVRHLQNKFLEASTAFQSALRLDSRLWTSHLFLGIDEYRLNRFSDALPHLEAADRLNPNVQEVRFWLGATELALHRYFDGLAVLEGVLEKDPANTDALLLLAESYAEYGTQLQNQLGDRYPDSPAGLEIQGKAFEFEGLYEQALQMYLKAIAKDPNLPGIREAIERVQSHANK